MTREQMFGRPAPERGLLRTIVVAIFVLALPLALITTTIRVVISEQAVYDYAVKDYGAELHSGIPQTQLIAANHLIHDYLVNGDAGPLAPQITNSDGTTAPLFSAKETAHMADVRSLVQLMFRVQMLAVALVLSLAVVLIALWPTRVLAAAALYSGLVMTSIIGIVGVLAMTGFDAAWSQFHQIAFTNNLWELNPLTDHLIQMYPEAFWQDVSTALGMFLLAQSLGLAALSAAYLFFTRNTTGVIEPRERPEQPERDGYPRRQQLAPPNPRQYIR
ncbi:MAG: TIGR01906 family membrane protein [Chloroflexota bacterium]